MRARDRRFGGRGGKIAATAMAFLLILAATGVYGRDKSGARVSIALKDGTQTYGELIAVRSGSILILDHSGKDASYSLGEVQAVRIHRKSRAGSGALIGLLGGGATGFIGGSIYAKSIGACPGCEAPLIRGFFTVIGLGIGGLGGLISGTAAGRDITLQLAGAPEPDMDIVLKKLRKYTRLRDTV